jgi:hypothetical protein
VFLERLTRELDLLRTAGEDLPREPGPYLREWLESGYLTRRLPPDSAEEIVELTTEAAQAIRYVMSLEAPRQAATESRLASVISQVVRLAEETDANATTRMAALLAERDRIDQELARLRAGEVRVLVTDRAVERAREILAQAADLTDDFRRVRDEFERLHRSLRESLLDEDTSRGDVLARLFAGFDLISDSDAGRTFDAFWRLLTDPEQSARLEQALLAVTERPFAAKLTLRERRFLHSLMRLLLRESTQVHDTLQSFARSLKRFVQSREFLETRRISKLIRDAERKAHEARHLVSPNRMVGFDLELTSAELLSVSQWVPEDPSERVTETTMVEGETCDLTPGEIADIVQRAEIDFRALRGHIRQALRDRSQVSIGELVSLFPPTQGLGSIVGYMVLSEKRGEATGTHEEVTWTGQDGVVRKARLPAVYFLQGRETREEGLT